jgi:hypothetical protein
MLGTMRIVAQQNDLYVHCHYEDHPDHCFLKGGEMVLAPNQEGDSNQGGGDRADLGNEVGAAGMFVGRIEDCPHVLCRQIGD